MTLRPHADMSEASLDSPTDANASSAFTANWMMPGSGSYCDLPKSYRTLARSTQASAGVCLEASGADC
jgi:hypothetical protein